MVREELQRAFEQWGETKAPAQPFHRRDIARRKLFPLFHSPDWSSCSRAIPPDKPLRFFVVPMQERTGRRFRGS
jgi:hypothetical protein